MSDFRDLELQENKLRDGIRSFIVLEQERLIIISALELAKKAHEGQKRDEGDPYIIHPIRIANTLIYDLKVIDADIIIAGLLHDVVEDTYVPLDEIKEEFGGSVAYFVRALTRDKARETKREKFEKTINGMEEVKLLKACDWLDNLQSFVYRTDRGERWQRHLVEAKEMYIPLARATNNQWLLQEMKKAYDSVLRLRQ